MKLTLIYILMILILCLIAFLTVRFILQMVLLKDCPNCGRTVSMAAGRQCPGCGYVFLKNRHAKLNAAIALLSIAVIGVVFLDIYYFHRETTRYLAANPYLWRGEVVSSTEIDAPVEEITGGLSEEVPPEENKKSNPVAGVLEDLFQ